MTTAEPVVDAPQTWAFSVDVLPPSVNMMYEINPRTGRPHVTDYAEAIKDLIRKEARDAGFQPSLKQYYAVIVVYTMPALDSLDVDNGLKSALDSALSSRTDHRILHLVVDKKIRPQRPIRTDIEIWRRRADTQLIDWLRELVAREDMQ